MAGVLLHRAATIPAVAATIPAVGFVRKFAATATPRVPAAVTTASTIRLSFAPATIRNPIAAPLRRNHQCAVPEALEACIQRLEVDVDNKILALWVELQKGSVEACEKMNGIVEACQRVEKTYLNDYDSYLDRWARQDERITKLSQLVMAESTATSSIENAKPVFQVGKVSCRVVVTVVAAAASAGFGIAQLLKADTTTYHTKVADELVHAKTAELHNDFMANLEETVERAVQVAVAKEATRKSNAIDEVLQTLTAQMDEFFIGLDGRIEKAVELALAKQSVKKPGEGGGPSIT